VRKTKREGRTNLVQNHRRSLLPELNDLLELVSCEVLAGRVVRSAELRGRKRRKLAKKRRNIGSDAEMEEKERGEEYGRDG
jgi:hypothetical protein